MNHTPPQPRFISEAIRPDPASIDPSLAPPGAPAVPRRFTWREQTIDLDHIASQWKTTSPCHHGSNEQYVRRHWFQILTTDGRRMTIYFDRQSHARRKSRRWWLYSIDPPSADAPRDVVQTAPKTAPSPTWRPPARRAQGE